MTLAWERVSVNLIGWPHFWQLPAQTEKHAFQMASALLPEVRGANYIGFPWATLIDLLEKGFTEKAEPFLEALRTVPNLPPGRKVTVSQHIFTSKYSDLFAMAGISDLFWSHKDVVHSKLANSVLHPFPLYPVQQFSKEIGEASPVASRTYLFSFVGLEDHPGYLTDVRKSIAQLANCDGAYLRLRNEWHYEKQVYQSQIREQATSAEEEKRLGEFEVEFKEAMANSVFCLCPSGTGPNTIRLWEALEAGTIPVILSVTCDLPGGVEMWHEASVITDESYEAVMSLPGRLAMLRSDQTRIQAMAAAGHRIREKYGPNRFIHDVLRLFEEAAHERTHHSCLVEANSAYRREEFSKALRLYELAQAKYPEFAKIIQNNIDRARNKLDSRLSAIKDLGD